MKQRLKTHMINAKKVSTSSLGKPIGILSVKQRLHRNKILSFRLLIAAFISFSLLLGLPTLSATASNPSKLQSIGISVADLGNPYFVQLIESATRRAESIVGQPVKMLIRSDAYDLTRQITQLNYFIEQNVDLILLTAADEEGIAPTIAKAQRAGIKVIAVDVKARGADATITTDNIQAGVIACEYLAKRMNYQGNMVIINGVAVSSVVERVAGCKSAIRAYPKIILLSDQLNGTGSIDGGMKAMTYLMEAHAKIDSVFSINDPTALGAIRAAKQADRNDFVLASVDGAPFAIKIIQSGKSNWGATAMQKPSQMAEKAIEIGYQLLQGKKVEPNYILIPAELAAQEKTSPSENW